MSEPDLSRYSAAFAKRGYGVDREITEQLRLLEPFSYLCGSCTDAWGEPSELFFWEDATQFR